MLGSVRHISQLVCEGKGREFREDRKGAGEILPTAIWVSCGQHLWCECELKVDSPQKDCIHILCEKGLSSKMENRKVK
jgi:hypothetical protein